MKYSLKPQWFIAPVLLGTVAGVVFNNFLIGFGFFVALLIPAVAGVYVAYAKDNPQKLWFKRKLYGWGWVPVTWQGWLVTLIYVALIVLSSLTVDESSPAKEVFFTFILPTLLFTAAYFRIVYKKGEHPRWQWGTHKD